MENETKIAEAIAKARAAFGLADDATDEQVHEATLNAKTAIDDLFTSLGLAPQTPSSGLELLKAAAPELLDGMMKFSARAVEPLQRRAQAAHDAMEAAWDNPVAIKDINGRPARSDWEREVQKAADQVHIVSAMSLRINMDIAEARNGKATEVVLSAQDQDRIRRTKSWREYERLLAMAPAGIKAGMYSTGTNVGDEWVPTAMSNQVIEKIRMPLGVASIFDRIAMPTNPYLMPFDAFGVIAYFVTESTTWGSGTAPTASDDTTDNRTLTAKKMAALVPWSDELQEDSILPVVERLTNAVAYAIREGEEQAIVNGDTAATHQDSDVEAIGTTDRRYGFDGLRKIALAAAGSRKDLATVSDATLRSLRRAMGVYGLKPGDLAYAVGAAAYDSMCGVDTVSTMDKYGAAATVITGELGQYRGVPIIPSEAIREDLNASGVYQSSDGGKTCILLVNRRAFVIGDRRQVRIRVIEAPNGVEQYAVTASERWCFKQVQTTGYPVTIGYNITT